MSHILSALTYENRLAVITSCVTGLRINDVLNLRTNQLKERFTITEEKTLKHKLVKLPSALLDELLSVAGKIYVFENRLDARKHRTRQAVYKDIKRASKAFRIKSLNVSCHTARKIYAVKQYKRTCSIERVKELLNHSDEAVTLIYALADELTEQKQNRRKGQLVKEKGGDFRKKILPP